VTTPPPEKPFELPDPGLPGMGRSEEVPEKPVPALAGPPRDVPRLVYWTNLLGGFYNQFAWLWLGITGAVMWIFLPNADWAGLYHFRGDLQTAPGVVLESRETNCSENDTKVYAQTYRFTASDGRQYENPSYATGRRLKKGVKVTVEYVPGDPSISRIQGMRRGAFGIEGWGGILILVVFVVFLAVGLAMLVVGVRRGVKANRMLAGGKLALGKLKSKRPTSTSINDRTVWEFTFEFVAEDNRTYETKAKTHKTDDLSDPAGEYLLYDRFSPTYAALLDNMPGGVAIDNLGQLRTRSPGKAVASLLVPALVVSAHSLIAYLVLVVFV